MRTIGIEVEGFANKIPAGSNVAKQINGFEYSREHGGIFGDGATDQVEVVTGICQSPAEAAEEIAELQQEAARLLGFIAWAPHRPRGYPHAQWDFSKPRLRVLTARCGKGIDAMLDIAATHFHLGVDPMSQEGLILLNALNWAAPVMAAAPNRRWGTQSSGRLRKWKGFAPAGLLPHPFRFHDQRELTIFIEQQPLLVRELEVVGNKHSGKWEEAPEGARCSMQAPHHWEGNLWWLVRPRFGKGTVEVRFFPTVQCAWMVRDLGNALLTWCDQVLNQVCDPFRESRPLPPFMGLAMPQNEAEWWSHFHRN